LILSIVSHLTKFSIFSIPILNKGVHETMRKAAAGGLSGGFFASFGERLFLSIFGSVKESLCRGEPSVPVRSERGK
jgi:hypothetical protein